MQDLDAPPLTPLPQEPDNEPTEQDESGSRVSPTQQIARFLPRENSSSRIKRASSYTWTNLDDTDGVMF